LAAFSTTLDVAAPAARVWALVSDVRRVAGLFSYMAITDFTTLAPGHWQFDRALTLPSLAPLRWREQAQVMAEGELRFTAVGGDLSRFTGLWLVAPTADGARLTLALDYDVPTTLAPGLPEIAIQYVIDQLFTSVCRHVKEAAEASAA
jgi:hypothetical protein